MTEPATVPTLFLAAAVIDADGVIAAPGAVLHDGRRVLAAGPPETIGRVPDAVVVALDSEVITPAFANAHAHLDLSHLGPHAPAHDRPANLVEWAEVVRGARLSAPAEIAASVRLGVALSIAGGVAAIGDIAGSRSLVPGEELRSAPIRGVSFVEVFGQGVRQQAAIEFLDHLLEITGEQTGGVRIGIQPHAPYSCGPRVYAHAAELGRRHGVPLSTHLAETREELEFVRSATGPFADLLRRIGVWDDTIVGAGRHPVDALELPLAVAPWIAAHLNYLEPRHVEQLVRLQVTAVFCPRSHRFFGHDRDDQRPHRWRELIAAGVPFALGTDGLPTIDSPDRITPFDDARLLCAQGGVSPLSLMEAITTAPATALRLDPQDFRIRGGAAAGLLAIGVDPMRSVSADAPFTGPGTVRWLAGPWMHSGDGSYHCGFPSPGASHA